jgi:anti-sigma B factor antagonist
MARKKKARTEEPTMTATAADAAPLRIDGEMTIYTAADLKNRIVAALGAASTLEIDLSEVSEIDSAGLQLLMLAKREAAAQGKQVALVGHSHAVIECFDLCNVTATFGDQVVIAAANAG